jgi:signal peptidase I
MKGPSLPDRPGILAPRQGESALTEPQVTEPTSKRRNIIRSFRSWLVVLVFGAVAALGLRIFVVQTFFVPSCSMWPTLQPGDRMLVLKVGDTLSRGAVLVLHKPARDDSDANHEDLV